MPSKAEIISGLKWLGGAICVIAFVLVLSQPKKPEPPATLAQKQGDAVAAKVVGLLDNHPEEWTDEGYALNNAKRKLSVELGTRMRGPSVVMVTFDGEEMPGFASKDTKPTKPQQKVYDAAQRFQKKIGDKAAYNKAVRQKKAADDFLAQK